MKNFLSVLCVIGTLVFIGSLSHSINWEYLVPALKALGLYAMFAGFPIIVTGIILVLIKLVHTAYDVLTEKKPNSKGV